MTKWNAINKLPSTKDLGNNLFDGVFPALTYTLRLESYYLKKQQKVRESLYSIPLDPLTRLSSVDRGQCKQRDVGQLSSVSGAVTNPASAQEQSSSTDDRATNSLSVFPSLTYTLRSEPKEYSQTLKRELSGLASITEVGESAKRCDRSDCARNLGSNFLRGVGQQQTSLSECMGSSITDAGTEIAPSKTNSFREKEGRRTTTHSLDAKSTQRVIGKANDRKLSSQQSSETSNKYTKREDLTSATCRQTVGEGERNAPNMPSGNLAHCSCCRPHHLSEATISTRGKGSEADVKAENGSPYAGYRNEGDHQSCCENSCYHNRMHQITAVKPTLKTDTTTISVSDGGIYRFFIAETFKEDRRKKELVSRMRQRRLESLKAQTNKIRADVYQTELLVTMDDHVLKNTIQEQLVKFKESEKTLCQKDLDRLKGELDLLFAEFTQRHLGISFPNLIGLKTRKQVEDEGITKPHGFRYLLGDEEVTAIELWHTTIKEDPTSPAPPATKAVRRIWAAMTYIWIAKYFKQEGIKWTIDHMWRCLEFTRFPLIKDDVTAVYSLIPYLYWLEVLEEPDTFRKKRPDMETLLWCPTVRISTQHDWDYIEDAEARELTLLARARQALLPPPPPTTEEEEDTSFLPKPLPHVAIASLSLCNITEWDPECILEETEKYFETKYSPDLHPSVTKYHRLYVKLGVISLYKRLKNKNLAGYAAYASPTLGKEIDVEEIYTTLRKRLLTWYSSFTKEFNSIWKQVGDGWVSFLDDNQKETRVKRNPLSMSFRHT